MHCQFVSLAGDVFEEFRVTAGRLCLLAFHLDEASVFGRISVPLCLFGCKRHVAFE